MSKRKTVQAAAGDGSTPPQAPPKKKRLTWRQEEFVEHYVDLKGNGTRAAAAAGFSSPAWNACMMLKNPNILGAIEKKKEELQALTGTSKEKILAGLAAMAFATIDDFEQVWADPTKKKNYRGLGKKKLAIASASETITSSRHGDNVHREIKLITPGERRAAFNDLWDKLGLGKGESGRDRKAFLERFALLGAKLGRGGSGGGSASGDGS